MAGGFQNQSVFDLNLMGVEQFCWSFKIYCFSQFYSPYCAYLSRKVESRKISDSTFDTDDRFFFFAQILQKNQFVGISGWRQKVSSEVKTFRGKKVLLNQKI